MLPGIPATPVKLYSGLSLVSLMYKGLSLLLSVSLLPLGGVRDSSLIELLDLRVDDIKRL